MLYCGRIMDLIVIFVSKLVGWLGLASFEISASTGREFGNSACPVQCPEKEQTKSNDKKRPLFFARRPQNR